MSLLFRRRSRDKAARDVDRLLRQYGPEAYRVAGEMAWRQDAGLLSAPTEGHWHRVHCELGHQLGRTHPTLDETAVPSAPARTPAGSGRFKPSTITALVAPAAS